MPLIPGISYPITGNVSGPVVLNDNQSSPSNILVYAWSGSQNVQIDYSIIRGSVNETGRLLISTDGVNVSFSRDGENTTESGVTLSAVISGANVELQYISTSNGHAGQFFYSKLNLQ
jgi:hypothetical protein